MKKKFLVKALYWGLTAIGVFFLIVLFLIGVLAFYVIGEEIYKKPFETLSALITAVILIAVFAAGVLCWQWAKENYRK